MRAALIGLMLVAVTACGGGETATTTTAVSPGDVDRVACERLQAFVNGVDDGTISADQLLDHARGVWAVAKDSTTLDVRSGARLLLAGTEDTNDAESFATGLAMMGEGCGFFRD